MTCEGILHNRYEYNIKRCTCEQGRKANTEYINSQTARNKARTASETAAWHASGGLGGLPSLDHGKVKTAIGLGCTCSPCEEARKAYWREASRRRRLLKRIERNRQSA